jgi:hypothetical protein
MDMNPQLNLHISQAQIDERVHDAERHRGVGHRSPEPTVRGATPADEGVLERLQQLEGRRLGPGPVLVAERYGRVLAAISVADGAAVADPFRPTAALVEQLRRSRLRLRGPAGRPRFRIGRLLRSARARHA